MARTAETDRAFGQIRDAWARGDFSGVSELMTADVKYHMPPIGDFDLAGMSEFVSGFRQAFPDFDVFVDETIAEGDLVSWLWHCSATFSGESPAVPMKPTGKPSAATGTLVARFEDGRIVEVWHHGDWMTWLQVDLGASAN